MNFNDMPGSFVVLISCLHISSWDTIAGGFSAVTSVGVSRTYFVFWYCIGALLFMKIITSFFISAFVLKLGRDYSDSRLSQLGFDRKGAGSNSLQIEKKAVITLKSAHLDEPLIPQSDVSAAVNGVLSAVDGNATVLTPQEKKRLFDLSLRYSIAVDSMRHLRDLLREESNVEGRDIAVTGNKQIRRYSVDFQNTHLTGEDMEEIVTRMMSRDHS